MAGGVMMVGRAVALAVATAFLMAAGALAPAAARQPFYVSTTGNDSWSGLAPELSGDARDGPFATLARAVAAAAAAGGRTILVRGGLYPLDRPVELGPDSSGLRIAAFPGETPVLSGGAVVGGFVPVDGGPAGDGVFAAPLAADPGLDVALDGRRLRPAQSGTVDPDDPLRSGWSVARAVRGGADPQRLRYTPGAVDPRRAVAGVRIQALDRDRRGDVIAGIARVEPDAHRLTLDRAAPFPLADGSTFRLLGHPDFLRAPGEFAWDGHTGRLLVRPAEPAAFARAGRVRVARVAPLVRLNGATGVTLEGLEFADVPYDGTALVLAGGGGHRVLANRFVGVGTAVSVSASDGNLVAGNRVERAGRSGMIVSGSAQGNRITANRLRDVGVVSLSGAAVAVEGAGGTVVAHNEIVGTARHGIALVERPDAPPNLGTVIAYNRIRDTGRQTAEAGAVAVTDGVGAEAGTIIRGNDIRHTGGLATDAAGRWLDRHRGFGVLLAGPADGVLVERNLFVDTGPAAVFIHGGDRNRVENNVSVLTRPGDRFVRLEWLPSAGVAGFLRDNTIVRNIVHARVPVERYWDNITGGVPVMEDNVLDRAGRGGPPAPSAAAARTRTGPALANPHFVDPDAGDFRLRPDSPARALGIDDLPLALMGPEGAPRRP